jgi:hypothetical protein
MRHVGALVTCKSKYAFIDAENKDVGVHMEQKLMFKLGNSQPGRPDTTECKAVVCRVQHSRNFLLRHHTGIDQCLDGVIGDPLRQIHLHPQPQSTQRFTHNVMELFKFPALEAVLTTLQNQLSDPTSAREQVVESTFICDFHSAVYLETDFNVQLKFLPDLLNSYTSNKKEVDPLKQAASQRSAFDVQPGKQLMKKDTREYVCLRWIVDPKICFIDRFKWNPPVIDDILKKLQIFDHRNTIPKVIQRGVLDRCDSLVAAILSQILNQAKRD